MSKVNSSVQSSHCVEGTCLFTLVDSLEGERHTHFLLKSLRTFGGALRDCPVLVFHIGTEGAARLDFGLKNIQYESAQVDSKFGSYWFGDKVFVSAMAEEMTKGRFHSLVWLSTRCLVLQPPLLFMPNSRYDATFRPVHIKNVGQAIHEPLSPFWHAIYHAVGIDACSRTVRSFVDGEDIRPYFNTHLFSIDPSKGILRAWLETFRELVSDRDFQLKACYDQEHQIFLHQAILSALIVKMLDWERVQIFPMEYSYPLHLHQDIPLHLRPLSLESLVCPVYEGAYRHPESLNGLDIHEPLRTWIVENMPAANGS